MVIAIDIKYEALLSRIYIPKLLISNDSIPHDQVIYYSFIRFLKVGACSLPKKNFI